MRVAEELQFQSGETFPREQQQFLQALHAGDMYLRDLESYLLEHSSQFIFHESTEAVRQSVRRMARQAGLAYTKAALILETIEDQIQSGGFPLPVFFSLSRELLSGHQYGNTERLPNNACSRLRVCLQELQDGRWEVDQIFNFQQMARNIFEIGRRHNDLIADVVSQTGNQNLRNHEFSSAEQQEFRDLIATAMRLRSEEQF